MNLLSQGWQVPTITLTSTWPGFQPLLLSCLPCWLCYLLLYTFTLECDPIMCGFSAWDIHLLLVDIFPHALPQAPPFPLSRDHQVNFILTSEQTQSCRESKCWVLLRGAQFVCTSVPSVELKSVILKFYSRHHHSSCFLQLFPSTFLRRKTTKEQLERYLSGCKYFQRIGAQYPSTWWHTAICNSSSRKADTVLASSDVPKCGIPSHRHTRIHTNK